MTPETALQEALIAVLRADPAVTALVGDNVFDEVPGDEAKPPHVYLGPVNRTRLEACRRTFTIRMRWFAESIDFGRLEAWEIADAVGEALEGLEPDLGDAFACEEPIRITQAGDTIDPLEPKAVFIDCTTTVSRIGD
jgi:hypothetical protein